MRTRHRGWIIGGISVALLAILAVIAASVADEPLRRYAEEQANAHLPEYRITIGAVDLHPLMLAVDLRDVVVRQQANPEPPLAAIAEVRADARLLPLLSGRVGAALHLEKPVLSATRQQVDALLAKTDAQEAKAQAVAWQDRVRDLIPFRVALFVRNGEARYEGPPAAEPVRIRGWIVTVENVTNRPDDKERYPAALQVSADLLEQGRLSIDGHADLFAKPVPAVEADVQLHDFRVAPALKTIGQADVPMKDGTVEAAAHVVYAPSDKTVTVEHVTVKDPHIEYTAHPESKEMAEDVKEAASTASAWQDKVVALFPIMVQQASVQNGEIVYRPGPKADAILLHHVDVRVANIRNQASPPGEYPSDLRVTALLGDRSRMELEGRADFFARPLPGVAAQMKVADLHVNQLLPVAQQFNVHTRQGVLDLTGKMEYSNRKAKVVVDQFLLEGAKIDYVHSSETSSRERERVKQGAKQAKQAHRDPAVQVKVGHGKILNSEMGFVNKAVSPDYRVFMADMNAELDNFSTKPDEGAGVVKVTGKFMGSGPTVVTGTFRPEKPRPDFDLEVKIIKTQVASMNNLLRAYGNLDTTGGLFAFFSELSVKDNRIEGYVKPLLKDVDVYDPKQDKDKAMTQRLYQAVVGGVMGLLENQPRDEVATQTDVSGEVENPQADTWQLVGNLVQNAFFKAILPGFATGHTG